MPQPLSKFDTKSSVIMAQTAFTNNDMISTFSPNIKIGLSAMEIITAWANLELGEYHLFASLHGGAKSDAYDIYSGLNTRGEKIRTLESAARKHLIGSEIKLFRAIRKAAKRNEGHRNKVAHWCWGWLNGRSDVVLLVDPRVYIQNMGEQRSDHIFVYSQRELIEIAMEIGQLAIIYQQFAFLPTWDDPDKREKRCDELCSNPLIAVQIAQFE